MNWYDKISIFYDFICKPIYHKARKELVENLNLSNGDKVLLIACGTGLSFEIILNKIGQKGFIVGIDSSQNMLNIAQDKIQKNRYSNIKLIKMDANQLSNDFLKQKLGANIEFDVVIAELAFSVIPNWKTVIQNCINLLKQNGKIGVLDAFRRKDDLINKILNFLPKSNISRDISEQLNKHTTNYKIKKLGKTKILFIAIGEKQ